MQLSLYRKICCGTWSFNISPSKSTHIWLILRLDISYSIITSINVSICRPIVICTNTWLNKIDTMKLYFFAFITAPTETDGLLYFRYFFHDLNLKSKDTANKDFNSRKPTTVAQFCISAGFCAFNERTP